MRTREPPEPVLAPQVLERLALIPGDDRDDLAAGHVARGLRAAAAEAVLAVAAERAEGARRRELSAAARHRKGDLAAKPMQRATRERHEATAAAYEAAGQLMACCRDDREAG